MLQTRGTPEIWGWVPSAPDTRDWGSVRRSRRRRRHLSQPQNRRRTADVAKQLLLFGVVLQGLRRLNSGLHSLRRLNSGFRMGVV